MRHGPDLPYFPLWVDDWLSSHAVARMTLTEQGIFIRLLCFSWRMQGIPANRDELLLMLGRSFGRTLERGFERALARDENDDEMLAMLNRVLDLAWTEKEKDPTKLVNKRQELERGKALHNYTQRVAAAARARKAKGSKRKATKRLRPLSDQPSDQRSFYGSSDAHNQNQNQTTPTDVGVDVAAAARSAGVPEDSVPTITGVLRASANPTAALAAIVAMTNGQHPPSYPWPLLTRAINEMAATGARFSPKTLRAYCRELADPRTHPRAAQVSKVTHDAREFLTRQGARP